MWLTELTLGQSVTFEEVSIFIFVLLINISINNVQLYPNVLLCNRAK